MKPLFFALDDSHPLARSLPAAFETSPGTLNRRHFPDGESYLQVCCPVTDRQCVILATLDRPDCKVLPLLFLCATLKELGAQSVGLVAPYLCYMRQDCRFHEGEAVTSRIFATLVSQQFDWLITVDPHLHRYHNLDEIYSIPSTVVHGAPLLADWFKSANEPLLLVGPDIESEQWVSEIAVACNQAFVVATKVRRGDRDVTVTLPNLGAHQGKAAVIIDDVIASGQTLLCCVDALREQGFSRISCAAVHGIFADNSDQRLADYGLGRLLTCNSIPHSSNAVDLTTALIKPIRGHLDKTRLL